MSNMVIQAKQYDWPSYEVLTEKLGSINVPGPSRYRLVTTNVKAEDLHQAHDQGMKPVEVREMFGLSESDYYWIRRLFDWPSLRGGRSHPAKVVPIDVEAIADQVVQVAMQQLQDRIETQVKLSIAKALHDAAVMLTVVDFS